MGFLLTVNLSSHLKNQPLVLVCTIEKYTNIRVQSVSSVNTQSMFDATYNPTISNNQRIIDEIENPLKEAVSVYLVHFMPRMGIMVPSSGSYLHALRMIKAVQIPKTLPSDHVPTWSWTSRHRGDVV